MDVVRQRSKIQKATRLAKRWAWVAAVVAVLLAVLAFTWRQRAPSIDESSVWVGAVERGALSIEAIGTGVLKPREIRWLTSQTPATVQRIVERAGAQVGPESVIIDLASPEALEAVIAAESAALVAESELASARADAQAQLLDHKVELATSEAALEKARIQLQAERRAYDLKVIPEISYRRSEIEAEQYAAVVDLGRERLENFTGAMRAQVAVSAARLRKARSEAALRRQQADALHVRAGIDGVVQQVLVEEGQQVAAGANIARVARPDTLMAELRIPETQAKEIALGQASRIDTRLGIVSGAVARVDPAVDGGNVLVDVEFNAALPPGARPDLSVEGIVVVEHLEDVVYMPKPSGAVAGSGGSVFRVDPSGSVARRISVRFGRASARSIEIVEGLNPGDRVILSDVSRFERYDVIRIK